MAIIHGGFFSAPGAEGRHPYLLYLYFLVELSAVGYALEPVSKNFVLQSTIKKLEEEDSIG
jgi:hypothetical protein